MTARVRGFRDEVRAGTKSRLSEYIIVDGSVVSGVRNKERRGRVEQEMVRWGVGGNGGKAVW